MGTWGYAWGCQTAQKLRLLNCNTAKQTVGHLSWEVLSCVPEIQDILPTRRAQAYSADAEQSMMASPAPSKAKWQPVAAPKCTVCDKAVYEQEKLVADGKTFHKTCFRCAHCNRVLSLSNFASLKEKTYCKVCACGTPRPRMRLSRATLHPYYDPPSPCGWTLMSTTPSPRVP